MSNEIQIRSSMTVVNGSLRYGSQPNAFSADMLGKRGMIPGGLRAPTTGVTIDLSTLESVGMAHIANVGETYSVMIGIYDPDTTVFYPFLDLLPGESYVVRLSAFIGEQLTTGTGTGAVNNIVQARGIGGEADVIVNAFEK